MMMGDGIEEERDSRNKEDSREKEQKYRRSGKIEENIRKLNHPHESSLSRSKKSRSNDPIKIEEIVSSDRNKTSEK
jgi:hypothetical protein